MERHQGHLGLTRGRGFLLGATAGRTTLNGEGLQHEDGHSLVLASAVPNLAAYDAAFAYEVATIIADGIARMYGAPAEDLFYYLTLYDETYPMPAMPADIEGSRVAPTASSGGSTASPRRPTARLVGRRSCSAGRPRGRPAKPSGCWPSTTTLGPNCGV